MIGHTLPLSLLDLILNFAGPHLTKGETYLVNHMFKEGENYILSEGSITYHPPVKKVIYVRYLTDDVYLFHACTKGPIHVKQENIIKKY